MKGRSSPRAWQRAHGSVWRTLLFVASAAAAIACLYCINGMAVQRIGDLGPAGWSDSSKTHSAAKDILNHAEAHQVDLHDPILQDDGVEAVLAISAANDIHRVRSMFASVQHYQPRAKRILCLFGNRGEIDASKESFELVTLEDLSIKNMHRPLFWYSVVEGSTFIKPECMRHMFTQKGVQRLIYFDNDILLFNNVDSIYKKLKAHSFVLTPHMTEPLPDDGKHPQDIHVLASGTYNLGFLGVSKTPTALSMLDWWNHKLFSQAFNSVQRGMMTDQRWADYIPSMFGDAYIERTPGYNTAWWNLHYNGKRIAFTDKDHVSVGPHPMVFYHFSGFDYQKPEVLSKHQTRFTFDDLPNITPMYKYYSEQLRSFDTRTPDEHQPPFGRFDNGLVIPDFVRPWYATLSPLQLDSLGNPFATSLATNNGTAVLLDFLLENYCPSINHYMPQVLAMAYGSRLDLQRTFPHLCGDQNQQFLAWFHEHGAQQIHAMSLQMRSWIGARQRLVGRALVPQSLGAVVVGFLTGEFGVAESARLTAEALQQAQVMTKILPLVAPLHGNHDMTLSGYERASEPLGFNIFHVNADSMAATMRTPGVVRMVKTGPTSKRAINIAVWFWELSQFPIARFARCTEGVDEIWVATQFVEKAIAAVSPIPVYQIDFAAPQLAAAPAGAPGFDMRAKWDLRDRYVFFFNFDYLSCLTRKNPDGVLAAFLAAFGSSSPGTGPALVLKSINSKYSFESRKHWAEMQARVPAGASVHFMDQLLSHSEMDAALGTIDCYVSLHRAEGLGLGMLQAMQLRKPVIGTGYSGNMDFMRPDNSYLVDYSLVPVGVPWGPYEASATWAEPHIPHAAELMRHVYTHQSEAAMKGLAASQYVGRRYSLQRSGELIKRRLEYLRRLAMGS